MNCKNGSCDGTLGESICVRTGCHSFRMAYPCTKCGYLHFVRNVSGKKTATGIANRRGESAFFVDGEIKFKKEEML